MHSLDEIYSKVNNNNAMLNTLSGNAALVGKTGQTTSYAAGDDGSLYVIDSAGEEVGRFDGTGWLSYPVIGDDGTIYASDSENMLWAISRDACSGEGFDMHRPADINGDGIVALADFAYLAIEWLGEDTYSSESGYSAGDVDRDSFVVIDDLAALADAWMVID